MAALLKDALKPNLVQTLEGTPAFIHGGPFANIAHGCNSIMATRMALKLGDYVVTEAGFGADLGAEKFLDIKCRMAGLKPDAVVVVATVRALKHHGGVAKADLGTENLEALERGLPNLLQPRGEHHQRLRPALRGGHQPLPHRHRGRAGPDRGEVQGAGRQRGPVRGLGQGRRGRQGPGRGSGAPVRAAQRLPLHAYELDTSIEDKLRGHRHQGLPRRRTWSSPPTPRSRPSSSPSMGFGDLPVCMAKTQYSFSDDQPSSGAPRTSRITVRNVKVSAGAGFVVALTGDIMTMPGLPKVPAAEKIDVDEHGKISGLF